MNNKNSDEDLVKDNKTYCTGFCPKCNRPIYFLLHTKLSDPLKIEITFANKNPLKCCKKKQDIAIKLFKDLNHDLHVALTKRKFGKIT